MAKTKAEKLLGISDNGNMQNKKITLQQKGFLELHENAIGPLAPWRRRYCVIKDSFLLWYGTEQEQSFSSRPSGVFPLNGATIKLDPDVLNVVVIEHKKIEGGSFALRTESKILTSEWLNALKKATSATYEKAQQYYSDIEFLEQKGTTLEQAKLEALGQLKEKKEKLAKAEDAKKRVIERDNEQKRKFEEQLQKEQENLLLKENEEKEVKLRMRLNEERMKSAENKRKALEEKLKMANLSLRRLEKSLHDYFDFSSLEELRNLHEQRDTFDFKPPQMKKNDTYRDDAVRKSSKFTTPAHERASQAFKLAKAESQLPTEAEKIHLRKTYRKKKIDMQMNKVLQSPERTKQQKQRDTVQASVITLRNFMDDTALRAATMSRKSKADSLGDF